MSIKAKNGFEKPGFLIRYAAPVVVAFSFSFLTALVALMVVGHVVPDDFFTNHPEAAEFILFAPVGFIGVFSGTFCLERSRRRYGSIVLLGLGLAVPTWFRFCANWGDPGEPGQIGIPFFWPLLVGGLVPVIFFWFKSRESSQSA